MGPFCPSDNPQGRGTLAARSRHRSAARFAENGPPMITGIRGVRRLTGKRPISSAITRIGFMFNPPTAPGGGSYFLRPFEDAAPSFNVQPIGIPVEEYDARDCDLCRGRKDPGSMRGLEVLLTTSVVGGSRRHHLARALFSRQRRYGASSDIIELLSISRARKQRRVVKSRGRLSTSISGLSRGPSHDRNRQELGQSIKEERNG
jgi:hypothetical protein